MKRLLAKMKMRFAIVLFGLLIVAACRRTNSPIETQPAVITTDTTAQVKQDTTEPEETTFLEVSDTIEGDFNGDGVKEKMWLNPPKISNMEEFECDGSCDGYITFSNANLPPIRMEDCIDGSPVNEGDLNGDGADDVGMLPGWFTSCWHQYHVFSFRNGKWIDVVNPFDTHCSQWEDGVDAVSVDPKKPGHVIIRYMSTSDADFVIKEKSIKAKR
ncbi:MAG: hypothetical protein U0V74_04490 [Chitinophagales bacterium]